MAKENTDFKQDVDMFRLFLAEELDLYERKRKDYGEYPIKETGIAGLMVRILDKTHRVLHLSENGMAITVTDEQLKDSLMDIANYANMSLLELEKVRIKKRHTHRINV